jgi:hypothetical protein
MADTQTIPNKEWIPYLAQFTRENRGAHAKLEIVADEIGDQFETEDRQFDGVAADIKDNECVVWIAFAGTPDDHLTHGIQNVTALRAIPATASRGATLEFETKDGTKTLLELTLPEEYALPPASEAEGRAR